MLVISEPVNISWFVPSFTLIFKPYHLLYAFMPPPCLASAVWSSPFTFHEGITNNRILPVNNIYIYIFFMTEVDSYVHLFTGSTPECT